jgi:hypothetical protein
MKRLTKEKMEFYVNFLFEDLIKCRPLGSQNHPLIYGNQEDSLEILERLYDLCNNREEFLCTMHDASKINTALDFFKPILKTKYGEEYKKYFEEENWFREIIKNPNSKDIFELSEYCGMEKTSENLNHRKLPLIFIKGMEELLFKIEFAHSSPREIERLELMININPNAMSTKNYMAIRDAKYIGIPKTKGFGNHLRGHLHQFHKGIFLGTVKNEHGVEFKSTLGNYHYAFYEHNFKNVYTHIKI